MCVARCSAPCLSNPFYGIFFFFIKELQSLLQNIGLMTDEYIFSEMLRELWERWETYWAKFDRVINDHGKYLLLLSDVLQGLNLDII